jgi:integrase
MVAPLWPNRALGGTPTPGLPREVAPLDSSELFDTGASYKNLLRPALQAVGLPASRPATKDAPVMQGVRLHDLRHTAATSSAGERYMQVSKRQVIPVSS